MVGTAPLALLLLLGPAPVLGVHIGGSSAAISMELHTSQANGTGTDEELHTSKSTGTGNATLMAAALVDEELGRAHCCSCLDNSSEKVVHIELPTSTKFLGFDCARCRQGCRSLPIAATACNGDGFAAKVKDTIGPKGFALKTAEGWLQAWHQRPKGEHFVDFVKATTLRELQVLLTPQPTGKNGETEKRLHIERKELTSANSPEQTEKRLHIEQKELTSANSPEQAGKKEQKRETIEEYNQRIENLYAAAAKEKEEEEAKNEAKKKKQELAEPFFVEKCGPSFGPKFHYYFVDPFDGNLDYPEILKNAITRVEDRKAQLVESPGAMACKLAQNCDLAFQWAEPVSKPSCGVYADAHMKCREFIAGLFKGGEVPVFRKSPQVLEMFKKMTRLKVRAEQFQEAAAQEPCNKDVINFDGFFYHDREGDDNDGDSDCRKLPTEFSRHVQLTRRKMPDWTDETEEALKWNVKAYLDSNFLHCKN